MSLLSLFAIPLGPNAKGLSVSEKELRGVEKILKKQGYKKVAEAKLDLTRQRATLVYAEGDVVEIDCIRYDRLPELPAIRKWYAKPGSKLILYEKTLIEEKYYVYTVDRLGRIRKKIVKDCLRHLCTSTEEREYDKIMRLIDRWLEESKKYEIIIP